MSELNPHDITDYEVDEPSCIGCGTCWVSVAALFREAKIGDDFKAVITGNPVEDPVALHLAAVGCPSLSIHLKDARGEILFPTAEARAERDQRLAW